MKKSLQNKLKKYGAMTAAVAGVAIVSDAEAQVVYTDIADETFSADGDSYHLDLDGTIVDFTIHLDIDNFSNIVRIVNTGANQNMGSGSSGNSYNYPLALNSGAVIGSTAPWQNGASNDSNLFSYFSSASTFGSWGGETDKYLGLKFDIGGNTHYGWARLDVAADGASFTIKDYAYNSSADVSIAAGDEGLSTSISKQLQLKDISMFVANQSLNLNIPSEYIGYQIKLIDVLGHAIITDQIDRTSSKFDVSNFPKGVYIVLIVGENKTYANKIMIK